MKYLYAYVDLENGKIVFFDEKIHKDDIETYYSYKLLGKLKLEQD